MERRAEVESEALRTEVELGDHQTKAELRTRRIQILADPQGIQTIVWCH